MAKIFLDSIGLEELESNKEAVKKFQEYYWNLYTELARQREKIKDKIIKTLNEASTSNCEFKEWQRAVRWKYSDHPLCTLGSLKDPGGRFNIGAINPQIFPTFSALYITKDKNTALQEFLGQPAESNQGLKPQEIALTSPDSITIISVSGYLEHVFDLRVAKYLSKFVTLTKSFKTSKALKNQAKKLGEQKFGIIQKPKQLLDDLMHPNWRRHPMLVDIPSNSQLFGQLIMAAGIQGILYKSKLTGEECLAIYPFNFQNSDSFIQLNDESPNPNTPSRIDAISYFKTERTLFELQN
ncbi:MAG: RES domain-containing protein [Chloroflexi bacterium]|nr:RES domain-containing protein [Chloroflexota bacterium]